MDAAPAAADDIRSRCTAAGSNGSAPAGAAVAGAAPVAPVPEAGRAGAAAGCGTAAAGQGLGLAPNRVTRQRRDALEQNAAAW